MGCYSGICMFGFMFSKISDRVTGVFGRDRSATLRFFLITFFGIMALAVVVLPLLLRVVDGVLAPGYVYTRTAFIILWMLIGLWYFVVSVWTRKIGDAIGVAAMFGITVAVVFVLGGAA